MERDTVRDVSRKISKCTWQLMLDYTFIRNHVPINTLSSFRRKHTLGFLQLQHPTLSFDKDDLKAMDVKSSAVIPLFV